MQVVLDVEHCLQGFVQYADTVVFVLVETRYWPYQILIMKAVEVVKYAAVASNCSCNEKDVLRMLLRLNVLEVASYEQETEVKQLPEGVRDDDGTTI